MPDPVTITDLITGGGAAGGSYLVLKLIAEAVGKGFAEWRTRRNGNGHEEGEHGDGEPERRRGDPATLAVLHSIDTKLGDIHRELQTQGTDSKLVLKELEHLGSGIEAIRQHQAAGGG